MTGLVAAGAARADVQGYVDNMERLGITVPGGEIELLEWGYEACKLFEIGKDYEVARAQAVYNSGSGPRYNMTVEQADAIMHHAVKDLCPGIIMPVS